MVVFYHKTIQLQSSATLNSIDNKNIASFEKQTETIRMYTRSRFAYKEFG